MTHVKDTEGDIGKEEVGSKYIDDSNHIHTWCQLYLYLVIFSKTLGVIQRDSKTAPST